MHKQIRKDLEEYRKEKVQNIFQDSKYWNATFKKKRIVKLFKILKKEEEERLLGKIKRETKDDTNVFEEVQCDLHDGGLRDLDGAFKI